jgi:tetratricopeptide (TPR) repeat protein
LELAPNYAQIHWAMGNMLLRQGKTEEAFAEMKRALEGNSMFAATAAATALQFSDEAPSLILEKLGNSRDARIAMAISLARQNKFDPAVEIWNSIPLSERDEKLAEKENEFSNILLMSKKFRYARQIKPTAERDDGGLSNPGFEQDLDLSGTSPFHWKISEGAQPRIGFDEQQKYSGKRSLGIVFPKGSGKDFRTISQTVVVESNRSYNLNLRFRSDITTTGGLRWEIADAATGDILGGTKEISAKNGEWEQLSAAFKTPAQTEAVIVRLVRTGCQNCSIEGKLWFDDFSLGG